MTTDASPAVKEIGAKSLHEELVQVVIGRFKADGEVRRGVCLLNAGRYEEAAAAFSRAERLGAGGEALPSYLGACLLGQGRSAEAAKQFAKLMNGPNDAPATARIRHALSLWSAGDQSGAIASLRAGVRANPESAELHFQLGTLLGAQEQYEEAELRFTQALSIDRSHTEAMVNLALCSGRRGALGEAVAHLQRAQTARPHDPRIGLLLSQAAKALKEQGRAVRVRASMADADPVSDRRGVEELSHLIEIDPDFVDAFLSLSADRVDDRVFAMLLKTLEATLERQPEHAELHYHCGRVLERLGRREEAIDENEQAVRLDPTCVRALIELGKLYQATDRTADATERLERAIEAGADYADVYYLLGNLYRRQGQVGRARSAYRHALALNARYEAAKEALAALPS